MQVEFSRHIFKNTQILNFIKIRLLGAELFHEGRRTDMTKLIVAFRNLRTRLRIRHIAQCPEYNVVGLDL
jgi:hypothetical protein